MSPRCPLLVALIAAAPVAADDAGPKLPPGAAAVYAPPLHDINTLGLDLNADGSKLATAHSDRRVRVWKTDAPTVERTLDIDADIRQVGFTPDGKAVAVLAGDAVTLYDAADGAKRTSVEAPPGATKFVLSLDGTRLLTQSATGFAVATLVPRKVLLDIRSDALTGVAMTPDGRTVYASQKVEKLETISIWMLESDKPADAVELEPPAVALNNAGKPTFVSRGSGTGNRVVGASATEVFLASAPYLNAYDPAAKKIRRLPMLGVSPDDTVRFTPTGELVAVTSSSGRSWTDSWITPTGSEGPPRARRMIRCVNGLGDAVASADGSRIAMRSRRGGQLAVWGERGYVVVRTPGHAGGVKSLAITADGATVLTVGDDGNATAWDGASGRPTNTFPALGRFVGRPSSAALAPDGTSVLLTDRAIWPTWAPDKDDRLGRYETNLPINSEAVAVTPDGRTAVASSRDETVAVDIATGRKRWRADGPTGRAVLLAATAGGLFGVGERGTVWRRDALTGDLAWSATVRLGDARCLGAAADGSLVAAGTPRGVELFDAAGKRLPALETAKLGRCDAVAVSSDGTFVAVAADGRAEGRIVVFEVATRERVCHFEGHVGRVTGLLFAADGRHLVSAGADGLGYRWDLFPANAATPAADPTAVWLRLGSSHAPEVRAAVAALLARPDAAVEAFADGMKSPTGAVGPRSAALVALVEADDFAVRLAAWRGLADLGWLADGDWPDAARTVGVSADTKAALTRLSESTGLRFFDDDGRRRWAVRSPSVDRHRRGEEAPRRAGPGRARGAGGAGAAERAAGRAGQRRRGAAVAEVSADRRAVASDEGFDARRAANRPGPRIEIESEPAGAKGVASLRKRRAGERTFAWHRKFRRNAEGREPAASSEAATDATGIRIVLRRPTRFDEINSAAGTRPPQFDAEAVCAPCRLTNGF